MKIFIIIIIIIIFIPTLCVADNNFVLPVDVTGEAYRRYRNRLDINFREYIEAEYKYDNHWRGRMTYRDFIKFREKDRPETPSYKCWRDNRESVYYTSMLLIKKHLLFKNKRRLE